MLNKKIVIVITSMFFLSFCYNGEIENYKKALNKILETEEYTSITNNKEKYYVSNEVVTFSKLGKFFRKELEGNIPLDETRVVKDGDKSNSILDMALLNKKKCSKAQIYFSEIENNIFFAELIPSKQKAEYSNRPHFGISYVYMFKRVNNKIELLDIKQIDYN